MEEAIKSLGDSRQQYATDKAIWEKKLTSSEQEKARAVDASKELEKQKTALEKANKELEEKLRA